MGVYKLAGSDVVDRAQLVVVRSKPEDPDNPRYARIAHDFRCKNDKAVLLPVPMATREEMYAFLPKFQVFWKTDADRGFLQIVQAPSAIRHTGFEMFNQLWVSERMLFGQINGPAFFELNFNVMAHDLKFVEKSVKNFFDDVIGGASGWDSLLITFSRLLQQARTHGWKFKPAKTYIGWEDIEVVGTVYQGGMMRMTEKSKAAVAAIQAPRTLTEVRSVLGLFNQFRDRIPGYALRVQALTHLTRQNKGGGKRSGSSKISMTVEALEEFSAIKEFLVSPAVLVVFQPGRSTFVYSDASLGSLQPGSVMPGGLGGVITQVDPADGKEYVCAFASAGLTPAMRNYPTVRLEALAFIFVLSKFYDWLEGTEFVWRTDAKAHKNIINNRHSPNPALNRYFIGLQAFRFRVEWVPGLRMIADTFSRMVVVADGQAVTDTARLVFGPALPTAPVSSLFTWCMSTFPVDVGEPARCVMKVASSWAPEALEELITSPAAPDDSLQLTSLPPPPEADEPAEDGPSVEIGNPLTLTDPIYSSKDKAKMAALPHVRKFLVDGFIPTDANAMVRRWVKSFARQMTLDNGLLWKTDKSGTLKLQVLESSQDVLTVLQQLHDGLGHRGLPSVYNLFRLRYWTPCASKVIKQYIQGCPNCQQFAAPNKFEVPGYRIQPSDVLSHWSIDCIGPFPADPATGDTFVIMAVEWLSRWPEAMASRSIDAVTIADFIYHRICCRYGVPESLRSDHGSGFDNEILEHLTKVLKVNHHRSTPYYPQSNGLVERLVQTFKSSLKGTIVDQLQGGAIDAESSPYWAHLVDSVLYAYRCTPHSSTGVSPSVLLYGRELRLPGDPTDESVAVTDQDHKVTVLNRFKFLTDAIPTLRRLPPPPDSAVPINPPKDVYQVGDRVWVRDSKYDNGFAPVFAPRWKGPYVVKQRLDKNAYRLRTDPTVSGKRSTTLQFPINGMRLRRVTEQEIRAIESDALRVSGDLVGSESFVMSV